MVWGWEGIISLPKWAKQNIAQSYVYDIQYDLSYVSADAAAAIRIETEKHPTMNFWLIWRRIPDGIEVIVAGYSNNKFGYDYAKVYR
jgi:hypothetical protein